MCVGLSVFIYALFLTMYICIAFTFCNSQAGQQCCYFKNCTLAIGPLAGGTMDRFSPEKHFLKHQLYDVLPFLFCCKGLRPNCKAYYDRRPSNDGKGYKCPPPGMICNCALCFHLLYIYICDWA